MEWLTYLLKVSACSGLFYIFYHFCLQKLTFFSVNRIYLLSTLAISFVIPALQLQVERPAGERSQVREVTAVYAGTFTDLPAPGAAVQSSLPQTDEALSAIDWPQVLFVLYWLIAMIMLSIFAFQALQLLKHTRQINQKIGRLRVVFFTNCSFLNYVFLNREELSDEEMAVILQHENVHSAKDSVVFDKDKKFIALYGEVKLVQAELNIIADKAKYDDAGKIVYAKNVSFTSDLWKNPVAGKFMKFDLKDGSYQILTDIPGL